MLKDGVPYIAVLSSPAFKGTAPTNLSDCLNRVLQWSLGSVKVLFSSHYPVCNGSRLRVLERMAYVNATIYPLTSIPLVTYSLPCNWKFCYSTGKASIAHMGNIENPTGNFNQICSPLQISLVGSLWLVLLFLSTFVAGILEMSWSGFGTQEWWNHQQFRVIGGVSACAYLLLFTGQWRFRWERKLIRRCWLTSHDFSGLYAFPWTSLLVLPTTVILINLWAMIAGLSSTINGGYVSRGQLFAKFLFFFLVIVHLCPFSKGLVVWQNWIPTVVIIWSLILARVNPESTCYKDSGTKCSELWHLLLN